jgi:DNA-directed RNA polymerase beta' subunit
MYGPKLNDPIEGKRAREIIQAQLNKVNVIGDETLQKNLDPGNNIWLMSVGAGTKGTSVNINQMLSMVGLQGADLISGGETAIYSTMGDPDPVDYGLVRSNYREGLNPKELFLNAIDTRRALVGVSIGTAGPGALSRIIIKNMEGLLIQRDGTVRLQGQQIVQSIYGYTGFNPERMINITFPEGQIPFFIDIASTAERINGNLGYIPDDILEM